MAEDFSNYDLNMKAACEAANSNQSSKESIWEQYISGEGFKNILDFKWSVASFYNIEDEKQCRHFSELFFRDLETVFSKNHRDYAEAFFNSLSPAFICDPTYFDKFEKILARAKKTDNTHFINLLEEELEKMQEIVLVRGGNNFA